MSLPISACTWNRWSGADRLQDFNPRNTIEPATAELLPQSHRRRISKFQQAPTSSVYRLRLREVRVPISVSTTSVPASRSISLTTRFPPPSFHWAISWPSSKTTAIPATSSGRLAEPIGCATIPARPRLTGTNGRMNGGFGVSINGKRSIRLSPSSTSATGKQKPTVTGQGAAFLPSSNGRRPRVAQNL